MYLKDCLQFNSFLRNVLLYLLLQIGQIENLIYQTDSLGFFYFTIKKLDVMMNTANLLCLRIHCYIFKLYPIFMYLKDL